MKTRSYVLLAVILLAVAASPKLYALYQERIHFNKPLVSIIAFADLSIKGKFAREEKYYLEVEIERGYYTKAYDIDDPVRTYALSGKELYDQIQLDEKTDYAGVTLKSVVHIRELASDEAERLRMDPFLIISDQKYSKYVEIINLSK
ncbi:hypothetical protein E6C60_0496 [Paenibacillus algicola]|uniref:Uncharacterized protein n=1 Tax=Paenibacillus algicola TaxID=2565926 RepID=A0A4P8XLY3_9BACL|nr:hypothetical protein E6C60_0496 [Paenibacillus algicola]